MKFIQNNHKRFVKAFLGASCIMFIWTKSYGIEQDLYDALEAKKRDYYAIHLKECSDDVFACDSDFNRIIRLLNQGQRVEGDQLVYPQKELRDGKSAVIHAIVETDESGKVINVTPIDSACGRGDINLQIKWSKNPLDCRNFTRSAMQALDSFVFDPVSVSGALISRKFPHRLVFTIEQTSSRDLNTQIVDLSKRESGYVSNLIEKNEYKKLEEYSLERLSQDPIYYFYLGIARMNLAKMDQAVLDLESFLDKTGNRYFHYAADATARLAVYYYDSNDHVKASELKSLDFYISEADIGNKDPYLYAQLLMASSTLMLGKKLIALEMLLELRDDFADLSASEAMKDIILSNTKSNIAYIKNNL